MRRPHANPAAILRDRLPLRLALAGGYALVLIAYLLGDPSPDRFPGMFPLTRGGVTQWLPLDLTSFAFMVLGVALCLGQPGDYLLDDDWMVYVRRRRGPARFAAYLAGTVAYCLAFAGVQLVVVCLAVPGSPSRPGMWRGFACGRRISPPAVRAGRTPCGPPCPSGPRTRRREAACRTPCSYAPYAGSYAPTRAT